MNKSTAFSFQWVKHFPPILAWRKRRYERKFMNDEISGFRGVFDSFETALASAPDNKVKGFNVEEFEGYFHSRRTKLFLYDYPFLFWLDRILKQKSRVFDVGGNTGVHFVAYHSYLQVWEELYWEVCEVPVVVDEGRKFAEREGCADRLSFTSDLYDANGAEVLISAGTLQYIDEPSLSELLGSLEVAPKHLLLNKLPLYDGEPYITLQNGDVHFIAQRVFNRTDFLRELAELGYQVVDEWRDNSRSCFVPFYPERNVPSFTGLYLSRDGNPLKK